MTQKSKELIVDSVVQECYTLAEAHVTRRVKAALEGGADSYSVCESFGFAAALDFKQVKNRIAQVRTELAGKGARSHAVDEGILLLESKDIFAVARFSQKPKYCAARFKTWATTPEAAREFERSVRAQFEGTLVKGIMFGLHWAYMGGRGIDDVYVEEVFEDDLLDEAYPALAVYGGVEGFVRAYLDSDETVLILQGPAGTGKTRLMRKILAEMSRRSIDISEGDDDYGSKATALYTGDQKAFESDEIFARFITGAERAFVVEDADHILRARSDGNDHLHRFLAVADGVVRAAGRKVMFSTNLPNINEVDEALARPGRCFACLRMGALKLSEAKALASKLAVPGLESQLESSGKREHTLAEVYAMAGKAKGS